MRINIWVHKNDILNAKIIDYKYTRPYIDRNDEWVQISITQEEFVQLEDKTYEDSELSKEVDREQEWLINQYNRNRGVKDQINNVNEIETKIEESSVIKEYLTIKGKDFPEWWKSKSIEEKQIITGYFGH
jgi:hypothetical protein